MVLLIFGNGLHDWRLQNSDICERFHAQLDGAKAHVVCRYGRCSDDDFEIVRGGKMGAIETPLLFICVMDPMLHMLEKRYPGALVNAYADDVLLGHRDAAVLARMVAAVFGRAYSPGPQRTQVSPLCA